jgi:hypothetical protein
MENTKQTSVPTAISKPETSLASTIWWAAKKFLTDGANAWNVSPKMIAALWAVPFIVALTGVLAGLINKDLYKWFTREDGFAESLQVLFYSIALVLSIVILRRLWTRGQRGIALLYLGVCFGLLFLIGEELSWGQRLVGWTTPGSFASVNKQEETNLHNVFGVGATFKWIQLLVGAYGTILPLIVLRWAPPARLQKLISMVVPHHTLIPYFAFIFVWRIFRNTVEVPKRYYFAVAEYNEVMELILAMGIFFFMVYQIRRLKSGKEAALSAPTAKTGSLRRHDI